MSKEIGHFREIITQREGEEERERKSLNIQAGGDQLIN